jgi:molybdopterin/thiamine biosynthesis adenylyltransferase
VSGVHLRQIVSRDDAPAPVDVAFDRQLAWFTGDGQRHLGRIRSAIVGTGGTGSHVAQQLAYLGIRDFVLIDHDVADETSMNRLVTAVAADVGTQKAILARRHIKSVAPSARVRTIASQIQSTVAIDSLKGVDVLFGCVDNDGARLILNEISRAYCIPYFDLAVGIDVEEGRVTTAGGRVAVVTPGGPCLHCLKEIDVDEARFFLSDAKQRALMIEHGYVRGMDVSAPSVVSLNAAIGAAAVNEFAIAVSGLRPLNVFTDFDVLGTAYEAKGQRLAPRRVSANPSCVACITSGLGDRAAVERYARAS